MRPYVIQLSDGLELDFLDHCMLSGDRPPNKRFKPAGARRLGNESFTSAPQRRRDPLGGPSTS